MISKQWTIVCAIIVMGHISFGCTYSPFSFTHSSPFAVEKVTYPMSLIEKKILSELYYVPFDPSQTSQADQDFLEEKSWLQIDSISENFEKSPHPADYYKKFLIDLRRVKYLFHTKQFAERLLSDEKIDKTYAVNPLTLLLCLRNMQHKVKIYRTTNENTHQYSASVGFRAYLDLRKLPLSWDIKQWNPEKWDPQEDGGAGPDSRGFYVINAWGKARAKVTGGAKTAYMAIDAFVHETVHNLGYSHGNRHNTPASPDDIADSVLYLFQDIYGPKTESLYSVIDTPLYPVQSLKKDSKDDT